MPEEEFDLKKLKEEYPEFFEAMPTELVDLAFSEETSTQIAEICLENGIEDEEKIEEIAYRIGLVLSGQLPPNELSKTLWQELQLEPGRAEKIYLATNRLIFSQVKEILDKLYEKEVVDSQEAPSLSKEEPKKPPIRDIYREPIEKPQ